MKKPFLILVVLLLVSIVWVSPVSGDPATELSVSPLSIMDDTMQPEPVQTIRPMADSAYSTFRDWTNNTLTVRPMAPEGAFTDWAGRILTLKPNDHGTYSEWSSWVHLIPNGEGNYSGWGGSYSGWNDWPPDPVVPDGDSSYQYAAAHNLNDTSALFDPPTTPRALPISKVRLTIVAKDYPSDIDEQVQMMLSTVILANVSSFTEASGWNGWQRVGSTPWLSGTDYPSNYINTTAADKIGNFTFQTVPTTGLTWSAIQLRLRTWQSAGGNDQLKIYLYDGSIWTTYTVTPLTTVGSYRDIDVSTFLTTVTKINLAKMAIEKVIVDTADNIYLDYACIRLLGVRNPSTYGVTTPLTTTYASYTSDWPTNPFTGLAWTWSDIDLLQAGVRSVMVGSWTAGTYLRVTQLYVSVLTGGLYTYWDEWPDHNGDGSPAITTDYILAAADAKRQSSALPDTPSPPFPTIAKVQVSIVARLNETTDEEVQIMVGIPPFEVTANVDGFDNTWTGWTRVPPGTTGPWLDAADYPSNHIYTLTKGDIIGNFTFQNVASGTTWNAAKLRIRTWQDGDDTLKIELYDGSSWGWTTTVTPSTIVGTYMEFDVSSFLTSEAKINAAKMRLTKDPGSKAHTIYVDHAYLSLSRVYYGSPTNPSTSYLTYSSEWATSPATGLAWTWSDIDALEAGVISKVGTVDPPTWTGELRVTQLYVKVIEAGTYAQWDEAAQDEDGTYNSAISGGLSRSSQLENHGSETWNISRVQVSVVARADIDLPSNERERIRIMLVIGGIRYNSPDFTPTTAYATYSYVWTTNPAGGNWGTDWTVIDNLQAGVSSVQYGAAWKGEIRVTQLYVVVCRSGTYAQWDEATQNGDTDYVSATMKNMRESSQLQNPTHQSWDIARVRVVFYARVTEATDEKVQPMLVIGGEAKTGSEKEKYTLTTNYVKYTGDWGKNPYTEDYWTWDDIDTLEAGVTSLVSDDELWTGEIRVTQLYVEVAGPRFTAYVQVDDVTNLYSYEFFLNYTTDVLTAASISLGGWFPYNSVIWINEINDTAGYAHYSVTMPYGSPSGQSTTEPKLLANVTFFPNSYGESPLDLWNTKLRNPGSVPIAHDVYDGYFNNMILGDINRDQTVNEDDLSDFSGVYGSQSSWDQGDFNRDGKTDLSDLFDLGKNYGKSIPP